MEATQQGILFATRTGLSGRPQLVAAHNGTPTSKAAAKVVAPIQGDIQRRVLRYADLHKHDGFTQAEVAHHLELERQYLTHPTQTLERAGLIVKTDRVRYRPGSKAPSAVYAITPAGVAAIGQSTPERIEA